MEVEVEVKANAEERRDEDHARRGLQRCSSDRTVEAVWVLRRIGLDWIGLGWAWLIWRWLACNWARPRWGLGCIQGRRNNWLEGEQASPLWRNEKAGAAAGEAFL